MCIMLIACKTRDTSYRYPNFYQYYRHIQVFSIMSSRYRIAKSIHLIFHCRQIYAEVPNNSIRNHLLCEWIIQRIFSRVIITSEFKAGSVLLLSFNLKNFRQQSFVFSTTLCACLRKNVVKTGHNTVCFPLQLLSDSLNQSQMLM
jgi:hypothetical protein